MPFQFDPNVPSYYGIPTGNPMAPQPGQAQPGQGGGVPVEEMRGGGLRVVGGPPKGLAGATGKPGFPAPAMPPLIDYLKMRQATDKLPSLSSADDTTLTGLGQDYANTFVPRFHESSGFKLDKAQHDAAVADFMMNFHKDLPKFRDHFAKEENATAQTAQPLGIGGTAAALGQRAAGNIDVGLANTLKGLPGVAAFLDKYNPNPLMQISHLLGASKPVSKEEFQNMPWRKEAEAWLREGGEQNLPGGSQVDPLKAKKLEEEHPILAGATDIASSAVPVVASSVLGLAGPVLTGSAQFGGQAAKDQEDRIAQMDEKVLAQIPEYQHALKVTNGDKNAARAIVSKTASESAEQIGSIFGAVMNSVGGGALTKPAQAAIAKIVGSSVFKRVLASTVGEAAGLGTLGASQQKAETGAVNKATGENREADLTQGLGMNLGLGALFGLLGSIGHAGKIPTKPGAEAPTVKPGETPPPAGAAPAAEGVSPEQASTVNDAIKSVLAENKVKEGSSPEATLASAKDDLDTALRAEGLNDEQVAKAQERFEAQWRQDNGLPAAVEAAPQPAVQEAATPTEGEAAAAVGDEAPQPEQAQPEAAPAPEGVPTPGEVREAATEPPATPAEVHAAAPEAEPATIRELVTAPGIDPRLPFGVTERVAEELRRSLGRDPSPGAINAMAEEVIKSAGIDISDIHRREALGKLLEENPTAIPTQGEIVKKAGELLDPLKKQSAQAVINERLAEFEKHPETAYRRRQEQYKQAGEKSAEEIRDVLQRSKERVEKQEQAKKDALKTVIKKTDKLQAKKDAAEVKEVQNTYQEQLKKDQQFRDILKKGGEAVEKGNKEFRNVLKKTETKAPKR